MGCLWMGPAWGVSPVEGSWWLPVTAECVVCGDTEAGGMFLSREPWLGSGARRCQWLPEGPMVAQAQQWAPRAGDGGLGEGGRKGEGELLSSACLSPRPKQAAPPLPAPTCPFSPFLACVSWGYIYPSPQGWQEANSDAVVKSCSTQASIRAGQLHVTSPTACCWVSWECNRYKCKVHASKRRR